MKGMKKLLSILMVLTLVLSLGAIAFAAEGGKTGTVTVVAPPANDKEVHTYHLYQIFSGTQENEDRAALGDVEWGNGIDGPNFLTALKADDELSSVFAGCNTAAEVAEALGKSKVANIGEKFAAIAEKYKTTVAATIDKDNTTAKVNPGYYLIVDDTSVDGKQTARNETMLQVTTNVEISNKYDVPSSDKFVKDSNDTANTESEWQKTGDWDIGDHVPFKLEAKIPAEAVKNFDEYELIFHDHEEKKEDGTPVLKFDTDSVKVFVNNTEITGGGAYTVVTPGSESSDPCTFEVKFQNIIGLNGWKDGEENVITVEYTSELTEDCIIGNPGNHNKMHIEFSNDYTKEGTGETPDVTVVVFTYDLNVDKIDEEDKPLSGAEFDLYKVDMKNGTIDPSNIDQLKDIPELKGKKLTKVELEKDTDGDSFYGKGLDDGEYWIIETVTPPGYNTIDPKNFTVSAEHGEKVTELKGNDDFYFTHEANGGEGDDALGQADIKNLKGATLPETGGIGTTIFYIAGAILVAGAVILLVTKKRVSGMEK